MKLAPVVASLKNTQRSDLVIFQNWFQSLTSTNGSFHTSLKTLFCSSQYLSCCCNSPFRQNQHFLPNWFLHMVNPGILCSWTTESRNWHTGLLGQCAFASQSTCPAAQLCRLNTAVCSYNEITPASWADTANSSPMLPLSCPIGECWWALWYGENNLLNWSVLVSELQMEKKNKNNCETSIGIFKSS